MAEPGKKPNNELYELNDLLAGVEPSEESLDDIMAEIYGEPKAPAPPPPPAPPEPEPEPEPEVPEEEDGRPAPVLRIDDTEQPDQPFAPKPVKSPPSHIVSVPRRKKPAPPPEPEEEPEKPAEPESPSAWVEPEPDAPSPQEIDAASVGEDGPRPDGAAPAEQPKRRAPQKTTPPPEEYRAKQPVPKKKKSAKRSRASDLRARAFAFADAMFSQAVKSDQDVELAEKYIPGTDEEEFPEDAPRRIRRPRRAPPPAEDVPPGELSRTYAGGLNFMRQRVFLLFLLSFVNCYLAWAGDTILPLPQVLRDSPKLLAGCELWLMGWAIVFSLDVIQAGFLDLKKRFPTFNSIASVGVIVTVADTIGYCATLREGPAPYCAPATLILAGLLWGAYDRQQANYLACRQAALAQNPFRITKDELLWNARDTFTKSKGSAEDFGAQIQAPNRADQVQYRTAPLILLAALLFSILASFGHGHPGRFLWSLSVILMAACPLSSLLCYAQPWLRLTRRLEKSGAAVAGWPGAHCAAGENGVLITDTDIFPTGLVQFNGIKVYGKISLEKLAGCTASLIRASGSGLGELFDNLVRTQGGFYRGVDDLKCYEGGLSGSIRGEQILVGSADFMRVMDIPLPQNLKVTDAVFCAMDGALRGIFALSYAKNSSLRPTVLTLLQAKQIPVMVSRDFNVTPAMIRQKMKIPVERLEYPPVERRMELTAEDQEHDTLCGILSRDSVESYAEVIVGCRRLRSAVNLSSALTAVAAVIGLFLGYYLTAVAAFAALIPVNLIAFLLIWLVPTVLISGNVNQY